MGRYRGIIVHCRICVIVHRLLALFLYSRSFVVIVGRLSDVYVEKWNRLGIPLGFCLHLDAVLDRTRRKRRMPKDFVHLSYPSREHYWQILSDLLKSS